MWQEGSGPGENGAFNPYRALVLEASKFPAAAQQDAPRPSGGGRERDGR